MSLVCCKSGLPNFGRGICTTQIAEIVGYIMVPTFNADNQRNYIDLLTDFGQTEIDALLTADPVLGTQWTPSPRLYAAALPIADTVFDEATDGTKSFVREGIWSMTGEFRDKDAVSPILKKLKKLRCKSWSKYLVSRDNQLIGVVSKDGNKMYPLEVNGGSIDPKMMFRDAQATNKIMYAVDFDNLIKQEDLYVLTGEDLTTPVDFLRLQKLTDVTMFYSNVTATTFGISVRTDFVQGLAPNNDVVGLDIADFVVTNETDNSTITVTSVVESDVVDGLYAFTIPAQAAGDRIKVSMATDTNFYYGSVEFDAV